MPTADSDRNADRRELLTQVVDTSNLLVDAGRAAADLQRALTYWAEPLDPGHPANQAHARAIACSGLIVRAQSELAEAAAALELAGIIADDIEPLGDPPEALIPFAPPAGLVAAVEGIKAAARAAGQSLRTGGIVDPSKIRVVGEGSPLSIPTGPLGYTSTGSVEVSAAELVDPPIPRRRGLDDILADLEAHRGMSVADRWVHDGSHVHRIDDHPASR